MTKLISIVAMDENQGIAKDGKIPWHLPEDLKFFYRQTKGVNNAGYINAVVMGRKTYDSLPINKLKDRLNVVVTRKKDIQLFPEIVIANDLNEKLNDLKDNDFVENVYIIGGANIYKQTLSICDELIITHIEGDYNCDQFFPSYTDFTAQYSEVVKDETKKIFMERVFYKKNFDSH